MRTLFPPLLLAVLLVGCGSPKDAKSVVAVPASRDDLMRKPMTPEEQIARVKGSTAPEDKKQAAIARIQAGRH